MIYGREREKNIRFNKGIKKRKLKMKGIQCNVGIWFKFTVIYFREPFEYFT